MQLTKLLKSHERILLVDVKPSKYADTTRDIFSTMSKSGGYWIYVTINKPFSALRDSFIRRKIDISGIFFIDMASASGVKKDTNCLYLGDPHDLTSVSIAIDQALASMQGKKFVVFDTVNTLLNYNNESMVIRFMHSLTGKMRTFDAHGIFLSVGMDGKVMSELAQFCDKCIAV